MSSERKALLEKAYPEVLAFCHGLGLVFEVVDLVDLRWGIPSVSSGDHEAGEVFPREIGRCEQISAGPAFVVRSSNYSSRVFSCVIYAMMPGAHLQLLCRTHAALRHPSS
uniref:Uncharacterized protein n=1 Tax=Mola mola TaxID=94237 RepID=A0A3Q4AWS7_MOLML